MCLQSFQIQNSIVLKPCDLQGGTDLLPNAQNKKTANMGLKWTKYSKRPGGRVLQLSTDLTSSKSMRSARFNLETGQGYQESTSRGNNDHAKSTLLLIAFLTLRSLGSCL
ncbi:unnamed protein product [Durusdinium trenchii]|uniref:Uncharacterized protein n=1 Tax=Durusdinium trenchii TaxID=1381693 RepID=A0ABP0Q8Z2_9DINO